MNVIQRTVVGSALGLALAINVKSQTNLQFTSANATVEGAIQIHWTSQSNHTYQVQYANALATNVDGSTAWQILYDDYPSQGTNTLIGDFGNYNVAPSIPHPKYLPMRFYRVVDKGQDSLVSDEPIVSIVSPTNGTSAFGELTINVVAATDQPVISGTQLYVDGQAMRPPDGVTNWSSGSTNYEIDTYSINTCEWPNGMHTLFATTENESGYGDAANTPPVSTGHATSAFVPVGFSNLVMRISFSQPSFDPSSGQTQQVSAVFAANCNWTLQIQNVGGSIVRTVTGSGTSMLFNWDGNGDGGASIPAGIYYYFITAQTNGLSSQVADDGSGGDGSGSGPPAPSLASPLGVGLDSTELWAMPLDGSGGVAPLAIYPPGFDTNDLLIFEAPVSVVESQSTSLFAADSTDSSDSTDAYSGPASQLSPGTPQRQPTNPVKGLAGSFAIAYQTFAANGTNGFSLGSPPNEPFFPIIKIQTSTGQSSSGARFDPLRGIATEANNFVSEMQHWGWTNSFVKADDQLTLSNMKGSGTPFNQVNLGVFLTHSVYGVSSDQYAGGGMQMYFPVTAGPSAQWLRMSDMSLGGVGTNGLKWMALLSCSSLYHINWDNMQLNMVYPYNSYLHLLLGSDTDCNINATLLQRWARYMNFGTSTNYSPLTIRAAWYQAAKDSYRGVAFPPGTIINFIVAGDAGCFADSLQTWYFPSGSWTRDNPTQVYPYTP